MADSLREDDRPVLADEREAGAPAMIADAPARPRPRAREEQPRPDAPPPPRAGTPATTLDGGEPADGKARSRRVRRLVLMILVPLLVLGGGFWTWLQGGRWISTDNAYVQAGILAVSSEVEGTVEAVLVHDNQAVEAGEVLFRLDPEPFDIAVARAQALLDEVRTELLSMQASYRQKGAEIAAAESRLAYLEREYGRQADLAGRNVAAKAALDEARQARDVQEANLAALRQEQGAIAASLGGDAEASVEDHPRFRAALAALHSAERDRRLAVVRAPIDGIVANVDALQPGTSLEAGEAAFSLVASDDLWVQANPKETQLTHVRPGQPVEITVDTYPGRVWQGHVASLSPASGAEFSVLPAQNTSGNWVKVVQRIPVRIAIEPDPRQPPLRAGMSVEVAIDTGRSRTLGGVLAAALGHASEP
jgi:membrane fusion protein (multidrug efflux system)